MGKVSHRSAACCLATFITLITFQAQGKVTWAMATVDLTADDVIPGGTAGVSRTWHAENQCTVGQARNCAALDGGCTNLLQGYLAEQFAIAIDNLIE